MVLKVPRLTLTLTAPHFAQMRQLSVGRWGFLARSDVLVASTANI